MKELKIIREDGEVTLSENEVLHVVNAWYSEGTGFNFQTKSGRDLKDVLAVDGKVNIVVTPAN